MEAICSARKVIRPSREVIRSSREAMVCDNRSVEYTVGFRRDSVKVGSHLIELTRDLNPVGLDAWFGVIEGVVREPVIEHDVSSVYERVIS